MRLTLSVKVAASISVIVAVVASLALAVALQQQAAEQRSAFRETNVETLQLLALAVAPAVAEGRHERAQAALDAIANYPERFPDVRELCVLDREGRVVADLDPKRFNTVLAGADVEHDLSLVVPETREVGSDELAVAVPIRLTHPLGVVRATLSERRLDGSIRAQQRSAALFVFIVMAVLAIALHVTHTRLVGRRVSALAQVAETLRQGHMEVRATGHGNDEIAELGAAFNGMAEELSRYTGDLERLVAERTAELEAANEQLARLATTDQLTQIHNRRYFEAEATRALEAAVRARRPLSVVMLDVDRFKSVNDRFGHPVGDIVLRDVARVLKENARAADLVARVGGEEFAIAMPDATAELAREAAERLRELLEACPHPDAPELGDEKITASFGVAASPELGERLSELLSAADGALYAAKRGGRNQVVIAKPGTRMDGPEDAGTPADSTPGL